MTERFRTVQIASVEFRNDCIFVLQKFPDYFGCIQKKSEIQMIFNFSKPQLTSEITTAIPCAEPTRSDSSEELSKLQFTPERVFTGV